MLNIKNVFPLKRGEALRTAAIGKQDLVPKHICQSCCYLTSIKNLQPKKKLYKIAWSPFFAKVCTGAALHQQINLYEKAAAKCLTHTGISEPVMGIDWFLLKLLVHISLFTSPKSITNLVWVLFLSYSSTLKGRTPWKRAHHIHCLLEDGLCPF